MSQFLVFFFWGGGCWCLKSSNGIATTKKWVEAGFLCGGHPFFLRVVICLRFKRELIRFLFAH